MSAQITAAARTILSAANAGQRADAENLITAAAEVLAGFDPAKVRATTKVARSALDSYRITIRARGLRAVPMADDIAVIAQTLAV